MNGKAHVTVGGLVGLGISNYVGADVPTMVSFTLLGGFVGLVPDLDVNGTLANKITLNKKTVQAMLGFIGLFIIFYSFFYEDGMEQWIGVGIGIVLFIVPSLIVKQKTMLLLTGVAVLLAGIFFDELWLILFGIYIAVASLLPHRSLTHSIIGLAYFCTIGYLLEQKLQIEGILLVCSASYASHLILDMKWIPMNRKGVKLFQPFSKFEL